PSREGEPSLRATASLLIRSKRKGQPKLPFPLIGASRSFPLYCKQDIFIFYIQWLIFLLIGNTMKNTMLRKGLTIF
ncbi:TPA: hypothetical protein ACGAUY_006921, partial [Pseudomonas aeruginosa]